MTFDEWKAKCLEVAEDLELPIGNELWSEDDPYELLDDAKLSFKEGVTPDRFINVHFEEDIARIEYDEELRRESEEWQDIEDEGW